MAISWYDLSAKNSVIKIDPVGIHIKNQICLSTSRPAFDLFFPFDCRFYIICFFKIHQLVHFIFCRKAVGIGIVFVFIYPADQVSGHSGIQHRMIFICQNLYIILHIFYPLPGDCHVASLLAMTWFSETGSIFYQMSIFTAYFAFRSIHSFLGSTCSPIRTVKMASARRASSRVIRRSVRFSGSMVVSHSS